jgi:hypothetical protein
MQIRHLKVYKSLISGIWLLPVAIVMAMVCGLAASSAAVAQPMHRSTSLPQGVAEAAAYPLVRSTAISLGASGCPVAEVGHSRSGQPRPAVATCSGRTVSTRTEITQELALAPDAGLCQLNHLVRNRHSSCGEIKISYRIIEIPSGNVVGTAKVVTTYMETLSARSRKWPLELTMELEDATGEATSGVTATIHIDCTGGCKNLTGPVLLPLPPGEAAGTQFIIESAGSKTDSTHQAPVFFLSHPNASNTKNIKLPDLGPARCDSVAVAKTQGCAFSDVAALYVLHVNGRGIKDVALHIEHAQRTKPHHFGWLGHGSPLTRLTIGKDIRANRRRACRGVRVPPGKSCDEYPFAATYQGAAFFPHDNSTAAVPAKENSREGGLRVAMYKAERLLAKDAFWVIIKP